MHLFLAAGFTFFLTLGAQAQSKYSNRTHSPTPPNCIPEMLLKADSGRDRGICKDVSGSPLDLRKHSSEADGVLFNYGLLGKREYREQILNFGRNLSSSDTKRALSIAESARKQAIEYVTGQRPESSWSRETRAIVKRIEAIKFRISENSDGDCYDKVQVGYPQAAYSSIEHTVGICTSMAKTTSEGIFAAVAHEIGHAVSTCNMKLPLVKYEMIDENDTKCLLGIEEEPDSQLREDSGSLVTGIVRIYGESEQGLDVDPEQTDRLVKCGLASRIEGSAIDEVAAFKAFNHCAFQKFTTDYRKFVAHQLFHWDDLPAKLSPESQSRVDEFKRENPQSCYRKSEEHFADQFAGHVTARHFASQYSSAMDNLAKRAYRHGLNDMMSIYCVSRVEKRNISNSYLYPTERDRVLSFFVPKYAQTLFKCVNNNANICPLPEDPASYTTLGKSEAGQPVRQRGRVR